MAGSGITCLLNPGWSQNRALHSKHLHRGSAIVFLNLSLPPGLRKNGGRFSKLGFLEQRPEFHVHFHLVRPMRKEIHPLNPSAVLLIARYPTMIRRRGFQSAWATEHLHM